MSKSDNVTFEKMEGFHKLQSLWKVEYKVVTLEPFLTQPASEETKEKVDRILGKQIKKDLPDAVPLIIGDRVVITGNAAKGVFRHIISAQLTEAKIPVCTQEVKGGRPEGRKPQCSPDDPCFVCTWFGTPSRQGALHFSFLESAGGVEEVLASDPIPMVALREDLSAIDPKARAFLVIAPVKKGVEFSGWIKGENLSGEIIGAIKEVQEMSQRGFVQFGGFKTRGFGGVRIEISRIEKYRTVPFGLEKSYEGKELDEFLSACQREYHSLLAKGVSA
jgi:CRISPR/Cas system CSM-associated protein Csm3 (group 7 of RAMP superfamily)